MKASIGKNQTIVTKMLIACVMAVALLATPLGTSPAFAKSMKAIRAKTTKQGAVISSKIWYGGAGLQNCSYSIKSVKVKDAKKAGYKTATVLFEVREKWTPSNQQIVSVVNYGDQSLIEDGYKWAFVVDGKTGENLETERFAKKYDVTVKTGGWKFKQYRKYTAPDGTWLIIPKLARIKYTITYPKSYKNLYVGLGVGQKKYSSSSMHKYETGRVTYGNSWWHKNNKGSTHFLRIK